MTELSTNGPAAANTLADHDRPVMVDGYLGSQLKQFQLSSLTEPTLGNDRFTEIYFETDSGNSYAIIEKGKITGGSTPHEFAIVNKNANLERIQRGESVVATQLPDEVIDGGALSVGSWFDYQTGNTTKIRDIYAINTNRVFSTDYLAQVTAGESSNIRQNFWDGLRGESRQPRQETAAEKNISVNDETLVKLMLYPDEGPLMLYNKLVGDSGYKERNSWNPESQKRAQEGVRELFEVALAPVKFREDGVDGARAGLQRGRTLPEAKEIFERLKAAGRHLEYQTFRKYDSLQHAGDFLHFGINFRYSDAPDLLPSQTRVYVTPKMEAVGHVAAEVIRRAREKGYEPCGKIWDESTNTTDKISPRTDRLLFYPRTESHLRIIMESLSEVQQAQPELFETDPPLLSEKTQIPGVGLAEEPPKFEGQNQSFNESRENILQEAWRMTFERLVGNAKVEHVVGSNGMYLDKRLVDLRKAVANGTVPMANVVSVFRSAVKHISPKHGISTDNFARNA